MHSCLAYLPPYPSVLENIGYQINGLVVVFLALGSLWGLLELIGWAFRCASANETKVKPAPSVSTLQSPPAGTPLELVAVISAAVHAVLDGRRHRILEVLPAPEQQDWSREGRRQIFSSHKVR